MPNFRACWRKAPAVRFISLEILATGNFAFEYCRSSFLIAAVHATRFVDFLFFAFLAI